MNPPARFAEIVDELQLVIEPEERGRFSRFLDLLLEANQRFNLTAVTEPSEMWIRHIADSLTLAPIIASLEAKNAADVGSGGGLPAIPLAIAMPEVEFTLIEATGKKANFLRETAEALELTNVEVVNARAERIGRDPEHRDRYDVVTARALGRLAVMLEWTIPLAKLGGWVLAMKGQRAQDEIAEAKATLHALHATVGDVRTTPTGVIVPIEKRRTTPKMYPRISGAKGAGAH